MVCLGMLHNWPFPISLLFIFVRLLPQQDGRPPRFQQNKLAKCLPWRSGWGLVLWSCWKANRTYLRCLDLCGSLPFPVASGTFLVSVTKKMIKKNKGRAMKDSAYNLAKECQVSASYLRYAGLTRSQNTLSLSCFSFFTCRFCFLSFLGLPSNGSSFIRAFSPLLLFLTVGWF